MPFFIEREPQGYFLHLPKIFYGLKIYEMKTNTNSYECRKEK